MKVSKLLIVLCVLLSALPIFAQDRPGTPVENRFLFIVDTSAAMFRSAKAAREVVGRLIETGVQGQMRPEDTLGLWTYNETLTTSFPMQLWIPANAPHLAANTEAYLKKIRFEKKGQSKTVLPSVTSVIEASKAITVILISDGKEPMQGTPFDQEINAVYAAYERPLKDAKVPFVTVLVGRNGKLVAHAVNSAVDPIQIPRPPLPVAASKTNNLAASKKIQTPITNLVVPPLKYAKSNIIISKVVSATNASAAEPSAVATNANPPAGVTNTTATNNAGEGPIASKPVPASPTTNALSNPVVIAVTNPVPAPLLTPAIERTAVTSAPPAANIFPKPLAAQSNVSPNVAVSKSDAPDVPEPRSQAEESKERAPVVVAAEIHRTPRKFILIGASLLVIAGVLVFVVLKNSRDKSQASLISRSMNSPRK